MVKKGADRWETWVLELSALGFSVCFWAVWGLWEGSEIHGFSGQGCVLFLFVRGSGFRCSGTASMCEYACSHIHILLVSVQPRPRPQTQPKS